MSEHTATWWKGSFPIWIVVVMLGLIGSMMTFGVQRTIKEIDALHDGLLRNQATIAVNSGRISVLEAESKDMHDHLAELQKIQMESLLELRAINSTLIKK